MWVFIVLQREMCKYLLPQKEIQYSTIHTNEQIVKKLNRSEPAVVKAKIYSLFCNHIINKDCWQKHKLNRFALTK